MQRQATMTMFALMPRLGFDRVLDHSTEGAKNSVPGQPSPWKKTIFLNYNQTWAMVTKCAIDVGWSFVDGTLNWKGQGILQIPDDLLEPGCDSKALSDGHDQISIERVREYSATMIDQNMQNAQDLWMLCTCLMDSISTEGKNKAMIWEEDCTVDDLSHGICSLKVIMRESHVYTNATSFHVRTQLCTLEEIRGQMGHDMAKFNAKTSSWRPYQQEDKPLMTW